MQARAGGRGEGVRRSTSLCGGAAHPFVHHTDFGGRGLLALQLIDVGRGAPVEGVPRSVGGGCGAKRDCGGHSLWEGGARNGALAVRAARVRAPLCGALVVVGARGVALPARWVSRLLQDLQTLQGHRAQRLVLRSARRGCGRGAPGGERCAERVIPSNNGPPRGGASCGWWGRGRAMAAMGDADTARGSACARRARSARPRAALSHQPPGRGRPGDSLGPGTA